MGLFSYLEKKAKEKFSGVVEIPFQNGRLGNIREHDTLSTTIKFEPINVGLVSETIRGFQSQKFFGVLNIPFKDGVPGKLYGHRTIKAEEL